MSLLQAVQKAKDAAAHAKPFMKMMDSLAELDGELRAAGQLQKDAEDAAAKKAQLEADIPSLRSARDALGAAVNSLKADLAGRQAAFETGLAEQQKAADLALAEKHAGLQATHEGAIGALKTQIEALKSERAALAKEKDDIQSSIDDLRQTFQNAHAALRA